MAIAHSHSCVRNHAGVLFSAALLSLAGPTALRATDPMTGLELATRVRHAEVERQAGLRKVVSTRRYILKNKRWDQDAVLTMRMITEADGIKRHEILEMKNVGGLQKRVFMKVIDGEIDNSKKNTGENDITGENYDFTVLGTEIVDGRNCTVLQLQPKRKSRLLLEGKAWVDAAEKALVRVDGRTASRISFWIGRPTVTQEYHRVDHMWLSARNRTVSDVRFFGDTELTIEYLDYKMTRATAVDLAKDEPRKPRH